MITRPLQVPLSVVEHTIQSLQEAGARDSEGVVLWLGDRRTQVVKAAYIPDHVASSDFFHITSSGMDGLFATLDRTSTSILAQVHSHPLEAFHSLADDRWAIVRHVGALSVVVPYFASSVTPETFLALAATFSLSSTNEWVLVPTGQLHNLVEVSG